MCCDGLYIDPAVALLDLAGITVFLSSWIASICLHTHINFTPIPSHHFSALPLWVYVGGCESSYFCSYSNIMKCMYVTVFECVFSQSYSGQDYLRQNTICDLPFIKIKALTQQPVSLLRSVFYLYLSLYWFVLM